MEGSRRIDIFYKLEALKLIKEWSKGLIVIQSAAIVVVGSLLQNKPPTLIPLLIVIALFFFLIASIYMGAVSIIGTIPYIVQNLPQQHIIQNLPQQPELDIYERKGGLKLKHWLFLEEKNLGKQCMFQANFFSISLVLFAVFMIVHSY